MTRVSMPKFVRSFALAAAAVLTLSLAPSQRVGAMSLVTPGATPVAKTATEGLTRVRFGGGGHGGGFHGGGFHAFHGGGGGWHGGGFRYGGFRHLGGYRFAHFHHRRFFYGGGYYPYYYGYYHHPRCRIIWTYHGPRRVCRWHHWHRWYHRHFYW